MPSRLVAASCLLLVVGCQPQRPNTLDAYMVESRAESRSAETELASRRLSRRVSQQLQTASATVVKEGLRDPESARFRFDYTSIGTDSTAVCGAVNAKNGYGGYTGFQVFYVEFVNGRPIGSSKMEGKSRLTHVCGFTDDKVHFIHNGGAPVTPAD